jgi:lipoprotein NlpI
MIFAALMGSTALLLPGAPSFAQDDHPLTIEVRRQIREDAEKQVAAQTATLKKSPQDVEALSRRGDAHFFLAHFDEAAADFDAMVRIDPAQDASHWRRGIAWFYTGDYAKAAGQFERYHSFDNVDRENGIWRYLSQAKDQGIETARRGLLKYEKDDREPFPDVFRLFAGTIKPEQIIDRIDEAKLSDEQRAPRRFYADLYIGLNHSVENQPAEARAALRRAVANEWAKTASYGPRWMWHVGRVHYERLAAEEDSKSAKTTPTHLPPSPTTNVPIQNKRQCGRGSG